MKKDALDDKFMDILTDGNGSQPLEDINYRTSSAQSEHWELINDPYFAQAIERFIVKNRTAIATSGSRHMLREFYTRLKTLDSNGSSGGLAVDEFSIKI